MLDWFITEEIICTGPTEGLDLQVLLQGYGQQLNLPPLLIDRLNDAGREVDEVRQVPQWPPLPYELHQYKPWHRCRVLQAKPGITGLWQVIGRSHTTFDTLVGLDLRSARTMSLWSDIKILLATPAATITGKGSC